MDDEQLRAELLEAMRRGDEATADALRREFRSLVRKSRLRRWSRQDAQRFFAEQTKGIEHE
jgi:hypothetical protein